MFDVSFSELLVIGVIALVVIGPERLPKVARTVGHLLARAQRYVNDVKNDIQRELEIEELRKFKADVEETARGVQASMRETELMLHSERGPETAALPTAGALPSVPPAQPPGSEAAAEPAAGSTPQTNSRPQTDTPRGTPR